MCGICGIINYNSQLVTEEPIRRMMLAQKHRGPNDEGLFVEGSVGLGFVRLSVIDLSSAGNQPMYSDDGRYVIIYNGEVYNYIELRDELIKEGVSFQTESDTEVVLAAYQLWGEDCLHRFNGMWAFAIYDIVDKTLFISRDRYGVKPLYYIHTEDFFAFASEIPPLLELLPSKPEPNNQVIFDYLTFNRTDQTEQTFFSAVKKLQHGNNIKISEDVINVEKWYDLRKRVKLADGFSGHEEFRELFSSAVGLRLRSDVPVGVCLSGGLDSSSIVSVILKDYFKDDLNTFSAVYGQGQSGDESEYISEYADQLNNMHFITPTANTLLDDLQSFVKAHAEPIPSTSPYAQYKVMELAKDNVIVTLDGQGADEQLAGYHYFFGLYYKGLLRKMRFDKLGSELFWYLLTHKNLYGLKSLLFFLLPATFKTMARVSEKGYLNPEFVENYGTENKITDNIYGSDNLQEGLIDHFEFKLEHLLKWEDRNSMWFSLEARVPFLDYRLVEKLLATTEDKIIKKGMNKYILREAMKGCLPDKIRMRRDKIGFGTPQAEWFRTKTWQELIFPLLESESFCERGYIDPKKALKVYEEHLAGSDKSKEIWKWVHLEMWFREFID